MVKHANSPVATLADVAARAGVSPITASRALRGLSVVAPETAARVQAAAAALNYVPNAAARALAADAAPVVGVLTPSLDNAVFIDLLGGVYDAASGGPHQVQIADTRYSPTLEVELLRLYRAQRPAGMIVAGFDQSEEGAALLASFACPIVQVMEIGPEPVDRAIGFDHTEAGAAATAHLFAQGYKRPVFLAGRHDPRSVRRESGYRRIAGDKAMSVTTPAASSVAVGRSLLSQALHLVPDLDAVFCNNDDIALGALFEAQARGIDCPHELGVCGFNDLGWAAATHPALTSVCTPRREMGRRAYDLLFTDEGDRVIDLGFTVNARRSTERGG